MIISVQKIDTGDKIKYSRIPKNRGNRKTLKRILTKTTEINWD